MSVPIVHGDYNGVEVAISLDPMAPYSRISTNFALNHCIPRSIRVVHSVATSVASGPISVPTRNGWYRSAFAMRIEHLPSHDMELGADWFTACGASLIGGRGSTLSEPPSMQDTVLPGGHRWKRGVVQSGECTPGVKA